MDRAREAQIAAIAAKASKPKKKVKARQCRKCGDWNKGVVENKCYVCTRNKSASLSPPQNQHKHPNPGVNYDNNFPVGFGESSPNLPTQTKKSVQFSVAATATVDEVQEQLTGWELGEKKIQKRERRQVQAATYGRALPQSRVYDRKKVDMSGNDYAEVWAKQERHDIWCEDDVIFAYHFIKAVDTRIPNDTFQQGGRLYRLINTLQNSCEYLHDIMNESPSVNIISQDRLDDVRKKFIAPLAKKVLEMIERDEEQEAEDSDFSM